MASEANRAGVYSPPFFSRFLYAFNPYIYSAMKKFIFIFCLSDNTPVGFQYVSLLSYQEAAKKKQWFEVFKFVPKDGFVFWVCLDDNVALGD